MGRSRLVSEARIHICVRDSLFLAFAAMLYFGAGSKDAGNSIDGRHDVHAEPLLTCTLTSIANLVFPLSSSMVGGPGDSMEMVAICR